MPSIIYSSFPIDVFNGNCTVNHTYKAMLTTSGYTEDRNAHTKRSQITNEVTGTGYTAGGANVTLSLTLNTASTPPKVTLAIGPVTFPNSTITARKMIIYRARGGSATVDELVACVDNGVDLVSNSSTMTWNGNNSTWELPLPPPA
jgi:hypothetical protein